MGNLSFETDGAALESYFSKWGPVVDCFLPQDRDKGGSRGFGFVTFRDAGDARAAVAEADGSELDGRSVRVNEAEHKGGPGGGMPRGGAFSAPPARDKWGTQAEDDVDAEKLAAETADADAQKPDFGLSGALAKDETTGNIYRGHVLKWSEPDDARQPTSRWRVYEFKNGQEEKVMHIHRQSAYLVGRVKEIADILTMHPSCSGQHAVIQFRLKVSVDPTTNVESRAVLPYVLDLESTNGTTLNGERIAPARYVELREKDMLQFGHSTREYVLIKAPGK